MKVKLKLNGWVGKFLTFDGGKCRPTNICSLLWSLGWRTIASLLVLVLAVCFASLFVYSNYSLLSGIFTDRLAEGGSIAFAVIFDTFFIIIFSLHVQEHGCPKWLQPVIDKVTGVCPVVEWEEE